MTDSAPESAHQPAQRLFGSYYASVPYFKVLGDCYPKVVLCSAYKLALTAGQGDLGAKRGGRCIDEYYHDERQSPQPLGPRQQGWPETGHLRRRSGSMGLIDPVFAA
ncbi:MAG: hypothetical protein M0Z50_11440, partial [Planctomycetia bacterium]|nr:hypothetical protein [Planctomycetia bacterium]